MTTAAAPRTTRSSGRVVLGCLGLAWLLFLATATGLVAVASDVFQLLVLLPNTLLVVAGTIIITRARVPRIGWLLLLPGAGFNLLYIVDSSPSSGLDAWGSWIYPFSLPLIFAFALLILQFPTGTFPNRAARRVAWAGGVALGGLSLFDLGRAAGVLDVPFQTTFEAMTAIFGVVTVAGLVIQARHYRRRPRVEQLQIKWFLLAIAGQLLYPAMAVTEPSDHTFLVFDSIATSLWPITILIAITRFRLYEIDRLVSRTVAYVLVIASLAALFVGMVTVVTTIMPTQDQFAVAATTIAVVALFNPLRRGVVAAVDRRFNRTRYIAQQVIEGFGRAVQDETDVEAVRARLDDVMARTMAPATVAVWQPPTVQAASSDSR